MECGQLDSSEAVAEGFEGCRALNEVTSRCWEVAGSQFENDSACSSSPAGARPSATDCGTRINVQWCDWDESVRHAPGMLVPSDAAKPRAQDVVRHQPVRASGCIGKCAHASYWGTTVIFCHGMGINSGVPSSRMLCSTQPRQHSSTIIWRRHRDVSAVQEVGTQHVVQHSQFSTQGNGRRLGDGREWTRGHQRRS